MTSSTADGQWMARTCERRYSDGLREDSLSIKYRWLCNTIAAVGLGAMASGLYALGELKPASHESTPHMTYQPLLLAPEEAIPFAAIVGGFAIALVGLVGHDVSKQLRESNE